MPRARRLKSGAPAHEFTAEERSRGGRVRATRIAEERAERQREAADRARELVHRALDKVEAALDGGDPRLALTAARDILDRVLGKQLGDAAEREPVTVRVAWGPGLQHESWTKWATDKELDTIMRTMDRAKERQERGEEPAGTAKTPWLDAQERAHGVRGHDAAGKPIPPTPRRTRKTAAKASTAKTSRASDTAPSRQRRAKPAAAEPAAKPKPKSKSKPKRSSPKRSDALLSPAVRAALEKQEAAKAERQAEAEAREQRRQEKKAEQPRRPRAASQISAGTMDRSF